MADYYILLPGDSESDVLYETNTLGTESFEVFYPSAGFEVLKNIINHKPELLELIKIIDDKKNSHTITKFFDKLENCKIKT